MWRLQFDARPLLDAVRNSIDVRLPVYHEIAELSATLAALVEHDRVVAIVVVAPD